jgi:Flp pilus assembly protein TadB
MSRRVRAIEKATETAITDDGFTTAMELALTPAVFGLLGFGLDLWLGVTPLFTIVFALWAFTVVAWMTWRRYDDKMARMEAQLPARGLRRDEQA